ncbi:MAG: carbohydrate kinase family protein [Streptosporangiales bacterium]|nr:carbohydrate kinase family protein [Streptosporangiales bacterium]
MTELALGPGPAGHGAEEDCPPESDPYLKPLDDPCEDRQELGERVVGTHGEPYDVFLVGTVFLDMIFTGMNGPPQPGTELWTSGLGSAPGGIANMAVAMSRLGLKVGLAAAFGDDMFGAYLWRTLSEQEQVCLCSSHRVKGWPTPVTVSMAYAADRSMVTYGEPLPFEEQALVSDPPACRACFIDLDGPLPEWVAGARKNGAVVFGDVGWDPTGEWSTTSLFDRLAEVDVFLPNAVEAMSYTRTSTPEAALEELSPHVPVVVVKAGRQGAYAIDRRTGERVHEPAVEVDAIDPTGAGDVFAASFVLATLSGWTLAQRVRFANLCAALSVRQFSGSLGAPCWHEVGEWFCATGIPADYSFLAPYVPEAHGADRARAHPTVRYADAPPAAS